MNLRRLGEKFPFLQSNLIFWEKYLAAREEVMRLLPIMVSEQALSELDFLNHMGDGKPFLSYETIRLNEREIEDLAQAFCRPLGIVLPPIVIPRPLPLLENLQVNADHTGFVMAELHSIISSYIESVIAADEEAINWLEPNCPICGAHAAMGLLTPAGKKNLVCSHCWTTWVYSRTACGLCGHVQDKGITYYTADEEPSWLLETCDQCGYYQKVCDMRKSLPDIISYPLHYLTSWNLDLTMREKDFEAALFLIFTRAAWLKMPVGH